MKFQDKNLMEFTTELASKAAVPGGGGASALVGAVGVALGNMVGELTVGKKKYADVEADIKVLMEKAEEQIVTFTCARLLFTAVAIPGIMSQQVLEYYKNKAISAVEQGLEPLCF